MGGETITEYRLKRIDVGHIPRRVMSQIMLLFIADHVCLIHLTRQGRWKGGEKLVLSLDSTAQF